MNPDLQTTTVIPAGTYEIDPAHTTVEFAVKHLGFATVKGRALGVTGRLEGGERPRVEATFPVAELTTFQPDRDQHLRTPDFFDAERHPEIRFVGTDLVRGVDGLVWEGELTIRGVTKPFSLRVTETGTAVDATGMDRVGLDAEGEIDRRDFGVSWNEILPGGNLLIANTVRLYASVSAVLQG